MISRKIQCLFCLSDPSDIMGVIFVRTESKLLNHYTKLKPCILWPLLWGTSVSCHFPLMSCVREVFVFFRFLSTSSALALHMLASWNIFYWSPTCPSGFSVSAFLQDILSNSTSTFWLSFHHTLTYLTTIRALISSFYKCQNCLVVWESFDTILYHC